MRRDFTYITLIRGVDKRYRLLFSGRLSKPHFNSAGTALRYARLRLKQLKMNNHEFIIKVKIEKPDVVA